MEPTQPVTQTASTARVDRKDLLAAIRALKPLVYKQDPYIHVGTDNGLYLEAGNSNEHARYFLDSDTDGEFDSVVTLSTLTGAVKGCPGRDVQFIAAGDQMSLKAGGVSHRLTTSEHDFPHCDYGTTEQLAHFGPEAIARLIETISHVGPDETRPVLTGVHITYDDDRITRAVATDSYRLMVKQLADDRVVPGLDLLLPGKPLLAALKSVPKDAGMMIHSVGSSHVIVDTGLAEWSLRRIDGQFPQWRHLVPDFYDNYARVDREELLAAVKDAATLLGADQPVRLEFSEGELGVRALGHAGEGHALVKLSGHPKFEDMVIGINHRYLRDALSNLNGEFVTVMWLEPGRPLRFIDELDDHTLNMPVST